MPRALALALLAATLTGLGGTASASCYVADRNVCEARDNVKELVLEAVECGPVLWDPCF